MVIVAGTAENLITEFKVTDAKLYVPVGTVSTQDNMKLLKQSKSEQLIRINIYAKPTNQVRNRYFDVLIGTSFQRVNGLSVLPFKDADGREN